jgi:hypothetical protein
MVSRAGDGYWLFHTQGAFMSQVDPIIPSEQQAIFALGAFAGLSSSVTGNDPDHATLELICTALSKAAGTIGTWNVVWGPSVVMQPIGPAVAMNTMYVAQSAANPSQYVIGIAGTNPKSVLDWIIEDGFVHWQVPWVYAPLEARGAKIALGTAIGLGILETMKPSSTVPGGGSTLVEFLATITRNPVQIAVVGHSLGGALAPTAALWLADTQGFLSHWDPHRNATVSALATAGPTAGNSAFAAYSGKKLGARLAPYYNTLDVVPHAWQASMLAEIPGIYVPHIPKLPVIESLVNFALRLSSAGDYTTLPGLTPLPGKFHDVHIKLMPDAQGRATPGKGILHDLRELIDLERFLLEVAYQHTTAYDSWFHFNPQWWPTPAVRLGPPAPSPALIAALSVKSATPGDIAQVIHAGAPRKLVIGGGLVDAPSGPSDPRGAEIVAQVAAELLKHGAPSGATGRG